MGELKRLVGGIKARQQKDQRWRGGGGTSTPPPAPGPATWPLVIADTTLTIDANQQMVLYGLTIAETGTLIVNGLLRVLEGLENHGTIQVGVSGSIIM
jgi:hypothetical protein